MAKRIPDDIFWKTLRENFGRYAQTARALAKQGYPISRQAVKFRAERDFEALKDIKEEKIDLVEGILDDLMNDEDKRVVFSAVKLFLTTQAKHRGYTERSEIDHTTGGKPFSITPIKWVNEDD